MSSPSSVAATPPPSAGETRSWTVTKPGTYTYLCDPHANRMKASFQVTR
ncbi:MAG: hypothetical protein IPG43_18170 [Proteobacteria bacterium]|nr:hypothetical protein [Pseudomonadota bacterium]